MGYLPVPVLGLDEVDEGLGLLGRGLVAVAVVAAVVAAVVVICDELSDLYS